MQVVRVVDRVSKNGFKRFQLVLSSFCSPELCSLYCKCF